MNALQSTNFEFDIEANRRRRAQLANDVTELISISKFFLQHYSSDSLEYLPPPTVEKPKTTIISKREKNETNVNKARGRLCSNSLAKKATVANVTPTHVKRKQTRMNNKTVHKTRANDDDVPPLFDKIKLHQYCVDIVDRFFHGPPLNDSDVSESSKSKVVVTVKKVPLLEKSVQTTNSSAGNEMGAVKPKRSSKYASVSSRYMNQTPKKSMNDLPMQQNGPPPRLMSAKSLKILNNVARKGIEINRHSCLIHKKQKHVEYREHLLNYDAKKSLIRFRDIHPNIELVPSTSIFPKRILKQSGETKDPSLNSKKSDDENNEFKDQRSDGSTINSNETEVKMTPEKLCDQSQPKDIREKCELQLQQLPVLSIKPLLKLEIEDIYEIEIKPTKFESEDLFAKEKNRVIELVHDSLEEEIQHRNVSDPVEMLSLQCSAVKNEYLTPFTGEQRISSKSSGENAADETHESSNLSLTALSTSSHLTDDEKYQSDKNIISRKKPTDFKSVPKTPAKSVIDKILEVEGIEESSEKTAIEKKPFEIRSKAPSRSQNFDDLREILRAIRNDRTTLDVALEDISEPSEFISNTRLMIDQEVQCESPRKESIHKNDHGQVESPIKQPQSGRHSSLCIDSSLMDSPKFSRTIESIRSSARKLDFNTNEYRAGTRDQIEKAAKKFLKSILKNADGNIPPSESECDCIHLKTERQKYHIVDDQIIQSNFNVKSDHGDCVSSSSSNATSLQLRLPSARTLNPSAAKCNKWIEQTDSDFTTNSIENYMNNHKLKREPPHRMQLANGNQDYSDLSDGEILSDGEFHLL